MKSFFTNLFTVAAFSLIVYCFVAWPVNIYKLTQCDFEPDYKCEGIRAAGVFVPIIPWVTAFMDIGEENAR